MNVCVGTLTLVGTILVSIQGRNGDVDNEYLCPIPMAIKREPDDGAVLVGYSIILY